MSESQQKILIDYAEIYVPLGIAVIGAAITWGIFSARLASAEAQITTLQTTQQQLNQTLQTIQIQVGEINTSVQFIEKQYKGS